MILNNPKYHQLEKMNKSTRWTSPTVEIPTLRSTLLPAPNQSTIKLYPNQKDVFDKVKDMTTCLVDFATGSGKSVLMVSLAQAFGGRAVIATHSLQLANQMRDTFLEFSNLKPTMFCGGKKDLSGDVVITSHMTLRKKYKDFKGFTSLFIDECDIFATIKSLTALAEFEAIRKMGFSGTKKIALDDCNDSKNGILAEIYGEYVKGDYDLTDTPFEKAYYKKYNKIYAEFGAFIKPNNWIEFKKKLNEDIPRKREQLKYIKNNTTNTNSTLILVDTVSDAYSFGKHFDYVVTGETKENERNTSLKNFADNGGTLVCTHQIAGRGYDNKNVDKVFILFPLKSETTLQQLIGRLIRKKEQKISALYLWSDSALTFQFKIQKKIIQEIYNVHVEEL